MLQKIHHIGVAVKSLEERLRVYRDALGLPVQEIEEVPAQKVRVAMLPLGESRIELLEATSDDSPIAGFLAKRGEGIHHIAVAVDGIEEELERLKKAGVRLINEKPLDRGPYRIAFVHPKSTAGVLLELVEPA